MPHNILKYHRQTVLTQNKYPVLRVPMTFYAVADINISSLRCRINSSNCYFHTQLDGFIARTWPTQKSALGSALDPLADKILISVLYVSLTYAELIPGICSLYFISLF